MILSRLYCNKPNVFQEINFNPGLNVILAQIKLSKNKDKDTHNLGKSTLGYLIDFCLLSRLNDSLFLKKQDKLFSDFVFFLEIKIKNDYFITIRRSVKNPSKISFKISTESLRDLTNLDEQNWDNWELPFEAAKEILDGRLGWNAIKPSSFRAIIPYIIKIQDSYRDPFKPIELAKPKDWKPMVGQLLGLNREALDNKFRLEEQLKSTKQEKKTFSASINIKKEESISKIEGLKAILLEEIVTYKSKLKDFDFAQADIEVANSLVEDLNNKISVANDLRYNIKKDLNRIEESLKSNINIFDIDLAEILFKEAGVLFQGQLKKDFNQLIKFNNQIFEERKSYLIIEQEELTKQLLNIETELQNYNKERINKLSFLKEKDLGKKYSEISSLILELEGQVEAYNKQINDLQKLSDLNQKLVELSRYSEENSQVILAQVVAISAEEGQQSKLSQIRKDFNDIITSILGHGALIYIDANKDASGGLEFRTEFIGLNSKNTDEAKGYSYNRIKCMALGLALVSSYLKDYFPHFLFHDGNLESLDDRKKLALLEQIRLFCKKGGQYIMTVIDSDLPQGQQRFEEKEIIALLHDEGEKGRLFKMQSW